MRYGCHRFPCFQMAQSDLLSGGWKLNLLNVYHNLGNDFTSKCECLGWEEKVDLVLPKARCFLWILQSEHFKKESVETENITMSKVFESFGLK